jgi:glycosyltransferase involved in cell wall biosynthesis
MSNIDCGLEARSGDARSTTRSSLAVLIPTLNRPHDLEIAVRTLLAQTVLPHELIIIDQSLSDESERRVRALFENSAAAVALRYTRDTTIKSLAIARNVALDQNRCEIFLFLDDDVELEQDFIERLMEGYVIDAGVTGISGIITNYRPGKLVDRMWQGLFVRGPFRDERQALYYRAEELRSAGRIPVSRFGGGLMSFRTDGIGGLRFDPKLKGASEGEDVDFCLHLPVGARLEIDTRARLVHKASAGARKDEHWIASVVRGNSYLYHRNWRHGLRNRIAFGWLLCGFALLAMVSSMKRASSVPWKEFIGAVRYGKEVGSAKK